MGEINRPLGSTRNKRRGYEDNRQAPQRPPLLGKNAVTLEHYRQNPANIKIYGGSGKGGKKKNKRKHAKGTTVVPEEGRGINTPSQIQPNGSVKRAITTALQTSNSVEKYFKSEIGQSGEEAVQDLAENQNSQNHPSAKTAWDEKNENRKGANQTLHLRRQTSIKDKKPKSKFQKYLMRKMGFLGGKVTLSQKAQEACDAVGRK